MSYRICQNSFSKGIISPSLQGRVDLEQYKLGVKNLKNGIVLQEGALTNRAGLEYLHNTVKQDKKSKLIPFVLGFNQNHVLEFGENKLRILKDGGLILNSEGKILEFETPYLENELFELDYAQQGDSLTIVHRNHKPRNLTRLKNGEFELKEINFRALIDPPQNIEAQYTGSTSSNTTTYEYVVCSVDKSTNEESTRSEVVSVVGHLEAYWTTAEYITISWEKVENAQEYNIYRAVNGIFGYVGTTNQLSFKDNNIEPDLTSCAPIYKNPFEDDSNPSCVGYFQQRKIYASTTTKPQNIWASQSGTNENFNYSRPLNSTDSINISIFDNSSNIIQHLIPFDDLIVITNNAEWCVNGADGIFCANPAPVAKIQSFYGGAKIKPIISGSMVLFVQSGGNIIRDLGYNYLSDSYDGEELTLFANHIFEGKKIVDMGYSKEPFRILWCIMDDGTINALTYNQKQKICAWHTHETKGVFESVAVIRENNEDIAYFTVKRNIDGKEVRYIERMKTRTVKTLENAFFLDSAMSKNFEEKVSKITGLEHLKNEKVNALLDYGVCENLKVNELGEVELPYKCSNVVIGLPYNFEIETLDFESPNTLGIKKNINKLEVKILNSREDFFIENDNREQIQNPRCHESINLPAKLFTKDIELTILSEPKIKSSVKILQKYPLPLTVLAISATINLEDVENM